MSVVIPAAWVSEMYYPAVLPTVTCVTCDQFSCPPAVSVSGGATVSGLYLAYIRQIYGICASGSYNISVTWDAWEAIGNQFVIKANGVTIYDTGCVTGSGSATVTIPAGTIEIVFAIYGGCNMGGGDLWAFTATC